LSLERPSMHQDRREKLLALAGELRPDLHRYCARLMGSVIDGEDVVQDTLIRALVALQDLEETPPLRPWLFRIAHNRALDLLRGREVRMAEPIDAAADIADPVQPDPLEMLMRKEAVKTAVSRFAELPALQRSVVILKDVLDESLMEIAALLDLTVDAVKGHLARGRAHLREINAHARPLPDARPASATVARYVALFNQRDWDGLRALLADVKLHQSLHPLRVGRADVGLFFTLYAKIDGVSVAPAWLEDREVIAVFEDRADPKPSYIMWLEWRNGRISFIRDYRYVRYVTADAELTLVPEPSPRTTASLSDARRGSPRPACDGCD
jgi:RNA polymerase sigma factor (sigma-70 family)